MTKETKSQHIVVGVDGSECSKKALRWAADYARLVGGDLTIVTGWHWPPYPGVAGGWGDYDPEVDARATAEKAAADLTLPDARVHITVSQGAAGNALVTAAKDGATLLVVGTRGHGGVAGAVLGSVSSYCIHHAPCPVVVVR